MGRFWGRSRPYNWAAWLVSGPKPPKGKQLERWHLHNLQQREHVEQLAQWLAEAAAATWGAHAHTTVRSTWVDARPLAAFGPAGAKTHCELGDLLIAVKTVRSSMHQTGRTVAMLFQAKCSDALQELDADAASTTSGTPTCKQRNLYEVHVGPFEVEGSKGVPLCASNQYTLVSPMKPCARYLLIPRTQLKGPSWWRKSIPYQTLWPDSRSATRGTTVHMADGLLRMAGLGRTALGSRVGGADDWTRLVRDLIAHAKRARTRGSHHGRVDAHIDARGSAPSSALGHVRAGVRRVFQLVFAPLQERFGLFHLLHMVPPGPVQAGRDEEPQRFFIVEITVSDDEIGEPGLAVD